MSVVSGWPLVVSQPPLPIAGFVCIKDRRLVAGFGHSHTVWIFKLSISGLRRDQEDCRAKALNHMACSTYHAGKQKAELRKLAQEVEVTSEEWDYEDRLARSAENRSATA
jgi:hypothetical protein